MTKKSSVVIKAVVIFYLLSLTFLLANYSLAWAMGEPLVPCGGTGQPECTQCELLHLVKNLIDFIMIAASPILATLFFIIAGVYIMLGGANPGMLAQGKRMFKDTMIGLIIVMLAWLITNTIIQTLVDKSALSPSSGNWWTLTCSDIGLKTYNPTPAPTPIPTSTPAQLYGCNQNNTCVPMTNGQYDSPSCYGACGAPTGRLICVNNACVLDPNGSGIDQCTSNADCIGGTPTPTPTTRECWDGIDNDSDGFIDYPNDPDCTDINDNSESGGVSPTPTPTPSTTLTPTPTSSITPTPTPTATVTPTPTPPVSQCVNIAGSGPIRIVLVASNNVGNSSGTGVCTQTWTASEMGNFLWLTTGDQYPELTTRFPPFNTSNISLWRSDTVNSNACSSTNITIRVTKCTQNNFRPYAFSGSGVVAIALDSTVTTLAHEIGHAFARLADEYEEVGRSPNMSWDNTNCKFGSPPGGISQRYEGCNFQGVGSNWFRDAPADLMYDNNTPYNQFGPVDTQIIRSYLP